MDMVDRVYGYLEASSPILVYDICYGTSQPMIPPSDTLRVSPLWGDLRRGYHGLGCAVTSPYLVHYHMGAERL